MLLTHRGFRLSGLLLILAFGLGGASISTPIAADNDQSGNMFDVTNLSGGPVFLLGTSRVNAGASANPVTVPEYYKAGSFGGSELTPGDWTQLGSDAAVTSLGLDGFTPEDVGAVLLIPSGATFGLNFVINGGAVVRGLLGVGGGATGP